MSSSRIACPRNDHVNLKYKGFDLKMMDILTSLHTSNCVLNISSWVLGLCARQLARLGLSVFYVWQGLGGYLQEA